MITRFPVKARSECVAPSTRPLGGVVESMRMFHAACAASQRPGLSPTRGSGDGAVADTIGSTGFGITAGAGGGGGGGVPRPPPGVAGAGGVAPAGAAVGAGAGAGADGVGDGVAAGVGVGVGVGLGVGVAGAAAGAGAGFGDGVDAVLVDGPHAYHPNASAKTDNANFFLIASYPPASRACVRFQYLDRRTHPTRT